MGLVRVPVVLKLHRYFNSRIQVVLASVTESRCRFHFLACQPLRYRYWRLKNKGYLALLQAYSGRSIPSFPTQIHVN